MSGSCSRQREGWPVGKNEVPKPRSLKLLAQMRDGNNQGYSQKSDDRSGGRGKESKVKGSFSPTS